MTKGSITI